MARLQFLYHLFFAVRRFRLVLRCIRQTLSCGLTGLLLGTAVAHAQAPVGPANLLTEVGKWVQQTQQLAPEQFSFAPMDSRVQLQSCDRALLMDLPFASRETVRVRCLGSVNWQLYLRLVFTSAANPGVSSVTSRTSLSVNASASLGAGGQKVVVGNSLLRAGTVITPDLLTEVMHSGQGLDSQVVTSIKDLENGEMVRDVPAGTPLRSHDVRRAVLVKQGQMILLSVGVPGGFAITARVEALQDGKMGEQVRLKNADSGRLLTGVVTGPNAARGL
jgi:flagella basal body P-ring formation protein FlgA